VGGVLVEARGAATVFEDGVVADPDAGAVGIELGAGVAGGSDETTPVGVGGGPGGFAERALAMARAARRASTSEAAPRTSRVTRWVTPSPSATI